MNAETELTEKFTHSR